MGEPLTWLAEVLEEAGVRVKPTAGWEHRAAEGEAPHPQGVLEHHTATASASEHHPAPTLKESIKGRRDLSGPLCNCLIGYDGTVHLIAAGRAHHAGKAKKSGPVPAGDGNTLYVGFEWDYDGVHKPPKKQYRAAVLATAAVLAKLGKSANAARGHKETSLEGKIDPGKVDMDEFREDVAEAMKKHGHGGKEHDEGRKHSGRSHHDDEDRHGDDHRGDSGHEDSPHGDSRHGGKSGHDGDSRGGKQRKHLPKPGKGPKPRSKMGPPDPDVYRTIYLVGKDMDVPDKVMLAAFEAGLAESQMSNLNWGDRDSVGVFQQRPSQGRGGGKAANCMNVNHASREFFEEALRVYKENRDLSAGELAQEVQHSGFPRKYDEEKGRAQKYLAKAEKHFGVDDDSDDEQDARGHEKSARALTAHTSNGHGEPGRSSDDDRGEDAQDARGKETSGHARAEHTSDGHGGPGRATGEDRGEDEQDARGKEKPGHARTGHDSDGHSGSGRTPDDDDGEDEHDRKHDHDDEHDHDGRERKRKVRTFSSWVTPAGDGSLSAFARSSEGDVVTAWQVGPKEDWVGWLRLGGDSEGLPVAARGRDGSVSVFALRSDGHVETSTHKGLAKWSKWQTISGEVASRPTALLLRNGAMMLFAVGKDGQLHTATQAGPSGHWGRWHPAGGKLKGQPTVVARPDGTVAVFALNQDGEVCTATQRKAGAGWSKWTVLGGSMASAPFAATMPDGDLLLIAVGKNGHLYTTTRIKEHADWDPTGSDLKGLPSVATDADGRVSVFARDEDDVVWVAQRSEDGDWSDWTRIKGRVSGDPVTAIDEDGVVNVFALGRNRDMYTMSLDDDSKDRHRWQRLVDSLRTPEKSGHDEEEDREHHDRSERNGRQNHDDDDPHDGHRKHDDDSGGDRRKHGDDLTDGRRKHDDDPDDRHRESDDPDRRERERSDGKVKSRAA